jgi:AcrR family transcriptional regulator
MSTESTRPYKLKKRAESMEATRDRITLAAMDLHGSVGPSRTTISAIAERAGVQRQTVYRHFADEYELFAACSGHFAEANPAPDIDAWRAFADPEKRLPHALDELYAWYERTGYMWRNIFRDEPLVEAIGPNLAMLHEYLAEAARVLAQGWGRRKLVTAATRHVVAFATWQSLGGDGGITRAQAVELASAVVLRAARP